MATPVFLTKRCGGLLLFWYNEEQKGSFLYDQYHRPNL